MSTHTTICILQQGEHVLTHDPVLLIDQNHVNRHWGLSQGRTTQNHFHMILNLKPPFPHANVYTLATVLFAEAAPLPRVIINGLLKWKHPNATNLFSLTQTFFFLKKKIACTVMSHSIYLLFYRETKWTADQVGRDLDIHACMLCVGTLSTNWSACQSWYF